MELTFCELACHRVFFSDHETEIDAMRVGMRERGSSVQETWANERRRVLEMSHVSLLGFCAICGRKENAC